ncbi:MAG TPA: hypothetical protein EYQ60_16505 [Myxococcales bacterium]|nr:hypothetical protein [Myxococcales bacterium]HIK86566.1 hypothetical protein [Myxococcales bacterium]
MRKIVIGSGLRSCFCAALMACATFLQGCSPSEIRGTYDVEIQIAGSPTILDGTLVLGSEFLDIPPLDNQERLAFGDWLISDSVDKNSCFILAPISGNKDEPNIVQVFEIHLQGDAISLPIEIVRMPPLRIQIVRLQFFANAMGGELIVHLSDQKREGRISGVRSDLPSAQRCLDEFETFREMLETSDQKAL